jgi:hypothetical protein
MPMRCSADRSRGSRAIRPPTLSRIASPTLPISKRNFRRARTWPGRWVSERLEIILEDLLRGGGAATSSMTMHVGAEVLAILFGLKGPSDPEHVSSAMPSDRGGWGSQRRRRPSRCSG